MATNFFGGSFFGGGFFGAGVTPVVVDTTHVGGGGIQPKRRILRAIKPTGLGGYRKRRPETPAEAAIEARTELIHEIAQEIVDPEVARRAAQSRALSQARSEIAISALSSHQVDMEIKRLLHDQMRREDEDTALVLMLAEIL